MHVEPTAASSTLSAGSALVSFFAYTLPVLQWVAAFVAIVAGVFAIIVAIKKRKQ